MNYLAHAYFSLGNEELLVGNMIADFMKGRVEGLDLPEGISKGIRLHRSIDQYADQHRAALKAKNVFRPEYRLYSGAFVDVVFDYYLANDPRFFGSEKELLRFTEEVFRVMDQHRQYFPASFLMMYEHMREENWLYEIRNLKGLERALRRLINRMKDIHDSSTGYQLVVRNYYELNQNYYEYIDEFELFVKSTLI